MISLLLLEEREGVQGGRQGRRRRGRKRNARGLQGVVGKKTVRHRTEGCAWLSPPGDPCRLTAVLGPTLLSALTNPRRTEQPGTQEVLGICVSRKRTSLKNCILGG